MRKEEKFEIISEMRSLVSFIRENEGESGRRYQLNISANHIIAAFMEERDSLRLKCNALVDKIEKLNLEPLSKEEGSTPEQKPNKKEKKNKKRIQIFEKQAELLE
jgi:hypothetical protein